MSTPEVSVNYKLCMQNRQKNNTSADTSYKITRPHVSPTASCLPFRDHLHLEDAGFFLSISGIFSEQRGTSMSELRSHISIKPEALTLANTDGRLGHHLTS